MHKSDNSNQVVSISNERFDTDSREQLRVTKVLVHVTNSFPDASVGLLARKSSSVVDTKISASRKLVAN